MWWVKEEIFWVGMGSEQGLNIYGIHLRYLFWGIYLRCAPLTVRARHCLTCGTDFGRHTQSQLWKAIAAVVISPSKHITFLWAPSNPLVWHPVARNQTRPYFDIIGQTILITYLMNDLLAEQIVLPIIFIYPTNFFAYHLVARTHTNESCMI
jgi:hypothetical protein